MFAALPTERTELEELERLALTDAVTRVTAVQPYDPCVPASGAHPLTITTGAADPTPLGGSTDA